MKPKRYKLYLAMSLIVAFGGLASVIFTDTSPKLGLDLEGGLSVTLTATGPNIAQDTLQKTVEIIRSRIDQLGVAEPEVSIAGGNNILIQLPGVKDEEKALELIGTTAQLTFRQVEEQIPPTAKKPPPITKINDSTVNDQEVVYPSDQAGEEGVLYRLKPAVLNGDVVSRAEATTDPNTGEWSVSINMNGEGAATWATFTSDLACLRDKGEAVKSQVAIVLDGKVESAAGMRDPSGGQGVECGTGIAGGQTEIRVGDQTEAKNLALVLRTGALPITLEQSEVSKVSPTLGKDSLTAGLIAGFIGLALVMLYMLVYYRALGLIVWLGLAIFTALIYTMMCILGAAAGLSLSLAGVAGIIVSVGITADSYIVAFERLKDEAHAGKSTRAAVERGMARAFRTILVADFVTGAAAVILFYLAVGPVRRFALTLGLATLTDVIVFNFFTRSAVGLLARTKLFTGNSFFSMRRALGIRPEPTPEVQPT
jgi:protein-export membrane protein SecD